MMDRTTGKTLSDCYVEFTCKEEALNAVQYTNQKLMKERPINVSFCMMEELLELIFPRWNSGFTDSKPNFLPSSSLHTFITQDEIDSLLNICKNYKVNRQFIIIQGKKRISKQFTCQIGSFLKKMC
jgi:RNA recognition motif-containing protein